jgi:hypothetical protein
MWERAAIPDLKPRGAGKIITLGSGVGHRVEGSRIADMDSNCQGQA